MLSLVNEIADGLSLKQEVRPLLAWETKIHQINVHGGTKIHDSTAHQEKQKKMQLANREITNAETQLPGYIRVWILLMRQGDIEPYTFGADIVCASIGRLHHTGATTRH